VGDFSSLLGLQERRISRLNALCTRLDRVRCVRSTGLDRSLFIAREGAVEILLAQDNIARSGFESERVHQGEGVERAAHQLLAPALEELRDDYEPADLIAMYTGGEPYDGAGAGTFEGHEGQPTAR
jgi:hypothetical protein